MSSVPPAPGFLTRTVHTETVLDADPEAVWAAITDLEGYARWNPVMTQVRGKVSLGERVDVRLQVGVSVELRCRIDVLEPGRRLRWTGGVPGLIRGSHYFECHAEQGGTRFVHGETFTGALVPLVWPVVSRAVGARYAEINLALEAWIPAEGAR